MSMYRVRIWLRKISFVLLDSKSRVPYTSRGPSPVTHPRWYLMNVLQPTAVTIHSVLSLGRRARTHLNDISTGRRESRGVSVGMQRPLRKLNLFQNYIMILEYILNIYYMHMIKIFEKIVLKV